MPGLCSIYWILCQFMRASIDVLIASQWKHSHLRDTKLPKSTESSKTPGFFFYDVKHLCFYTFSLFFKKIFLDFTSLNRVCMTPKVCIRYHINISGKRLTVCLDDTSSQKSTLQDVWRILNFQRLCSILTLYFHKLANRNFSFSNIGIFTKYISFILTKRNGEI